MSVHSVLYFLLEQLSRYRQPRLAAWLLYLITRKLISRRGTARAPRRALVLTRTGFQEDVEETFWDAPEFEVVTWPSYALKAFAAPILDPSLDHNFYVTEDSRIEWTKRTYRRFLTETWRRFAALLPIDVVLTGNFSYCAEREFGSMLEEAGTPFVAIHKENVRPPKRLEYWKYLYSERRGPFTGREVVVYNEIERQLEVACRVADPDRIKVAGAPRLDRIHRWRRANAGPSAAGTKLQVLFFAFARDDKLTAIQRKPSAGVAGNMEEMEGDWGKLSWEALGSGSHRALVELARSRPDINVVVKTKGQRRKHDDILLMLRAAAESLPPNLTVVSGGDPFNLMVESRVVVGFNTTGLLEAIAAGKPVIVPFFGEAQDSAMRDHIIDLEDAVTYAHSPEELVRLVADCLDSPRDVPAVLPPAASRVLTYWVGNPDGAAGRRVYEALREVIAPERVPASQG